MKKLERPARLFFVLILATLSACQPAPANPANTLTEASPEASADAPTSQPITPYPTRPYYDPGQLVDYIAQPGDTLPSLAAHFNSTEAEIRAANPIIPQDATTMPPGFPMKMPIYYRPLWSSAYQIIPDSLYVNGPAQEDFDTKAFVNQHPGWLKNHREPQVDGMKSGAEVVELVAQNFSISPRLLLALLEYQSGALSDPSRPASSYFLNYRSPAYEGLYLQLVWASNSLNNSYYAWRRGTLKEWKYPDGRLAYPDPWQNAASVALQHYFSRMASRPAFDEIVGPQGFAAVYRNLFGDPWENVSPHIPGSLWQPPLSLPFGPGQDWNYTGGPHTGWGKGEPFAAVDFAPAGVSECNNTDTWVIAMADGVITRSDMDGLVLDLDGDGTDRTGWAIYYLHLTMQNRPQLGQTVRAGDRLGHPSCEGGESTGTHVHIARKYNGEWILADGPLAFDMDGWIVHQGNEAYAGKMVRFSRTITASTQSEAHSLIRADEK